VPKRARASPITVFGLSYASDANVGGRIDIGRRVGSEQRFGIRFNGSYRDGDTQTDDAENRYASADLALDYRGERLGLTLDLGYADDELAGVQNLLTVLGGFQIPSAPAGTANLGQPWALFKTDATRVVGGISYALSDTWTASVRYGVLDHFEDYKTPASFRINNAAGEYRWRSLSQVATFDTRTGDIGIRGRFSTGAVAHDLAVSATNYFADNKFAFDFGLFQLSNLYAPVYTARPDFSTAQTVPLPGNEREFTTYAIADTLSMLDERLQVTLGVRKQEIEVINFVGATGAVLNRIDQSKTSPAYGVLYKFSDRWSGYVNATEALATGPQAPGGTVNQGQVFPPIEADQFEAGVKADFGAFGATGAIFETTQPFGFINPANNTFAVDGETRIRGVELTVFGSPVPSVRLIGGVTRLDGEQTRTAGGLTNGRDAVAVPHLNWNVYAEWSPPALNGLAANARVTYSDQQFLDPANTQWIEDWTRLDLGLRHTFGERRATTLRLNVENVLDEDYWQSTARAGVTRGGPRTILFSADVSL
jgi:iron complex outermembrane receptor protein